MSIQKIRRVTFNEVVRCAHIVYQETPQCIEIQTNKVEELCSIKLKAKPIVFKPRGRILPENYNKWYYNYTMPEPPAPTIVNGWFVDLNMRIHFETTKGDVIRTSVITSFDGNTVTTFSGSVYILGKMDILIHSRIANLNISESDPLCEETLPQLINAAHDIYGESIVYPIRM